MTRMASGCEEIHVEITAPDKSLTDIYNAAALLMEAEQDAAPDFAAEAEIAEEVSSMI